MQTSRVAIAAFVVAATALIPVSTQTVGAAGKGDNQSLSDLQRQRSAVRQKAAGQAAEVNALQASDAEVTAALEALNANVNAQRDQLDESERAVSQAKTDQASAEQAQASKQAELDALVAKMKEAAVNSYISIAGSDTITINTDDINDTVNKRTLMSMRANENITLTEEFRSVQEDLEIQRVAATEAAAAAEAAKAEVANRLKELNAAHAKQQAFSAQVDNRLNSALAEADALAQTDASLANSITSKQAEIARALEAQRAAERARAAQRAAQNKAAVASPRPSGGDSAPPSITGSGEIVTVGGIRVHRSMANNLAGLLAAASGNGISLSGGGFRDPSGQIAVRKSNCGTSNYAIYQMPASSCRPPTARPGTSMHEQGLAVDFTQGGRTLTRGSSGFAWMRANAGRFGFHNLPSEPWHWSSNGR